MAPWAPGGGSAQLFGDLEAVRSGQQSGRWDNSRLYGALHLALSQAGAVAEVLGNHAEWTDELFDAPSTGLRRHLLTVELADAVVERLVDIDNPRFLTDRGLRPSEVAGRARTRTRTLAADLNIEPTQEVRIARGYRVMALIDDDDPGLGDPCQFGTTTTAVQGLDARDYHGWLVVFRRRRASLTAP